VGFGPPPVSPYIYEARDFQGNIIRATFSYDDATKAINANALVHRDAACVYTKVIIGPPSNPTATLPVPSGDTTITVAQMAAVGVTSINTIINTQITAIP
jgi:hypothetical protein